MVVLLVDALGDTLARAAPGFAPGLPHRRRLETILGFSSGALPTIFTGRMPSEHGRWLMYRRADAGTPFRGFGGLRLLPRRARASHRLGRLLGRWVSARGVRGYFHLYDVPRELLSKFDLAERDDLFAPGGLPGDSLWDTLARSGLSWRGWNWRTPEAEALAQAGRAARGGDESLLFVYTADLDARLHREGSRGEGVRACLERYDAWIGGVLEAARERAEETWLYLLSDHGMVDVRATVDVMGMLQGLRVRWPGDYLAFFDATMARFWWRTPGAREAVRERLGGLEGGRWLSAADLERAGARFERHDYGEDVFLLDPGVLMVPSFMGREPLAAMHGYDPSHPDMPGILWSNRPLPAGVSHLRDVRSFLEGELAALTGGAA